MSRAREGTHVWAVADDLGQAREDLARDWSSERRPTWAIDTGLPGTGQADLARFSELPPAARARVAALANAQIRLLAGAANGTQPPDETPKLDEATAALAQLRQDRADLANGTGKYTRSEEGEAARGLRDARAELRSAEQAAVGARWRDRRAASKRVPVLVSRADDAARRWNAVVVPELGRLDSEIARQEAVVVQLSTVVGRHLAASESGARRRLDLERTSGLLHTVLRAHRDQLDGVAQPARTRAAVHPAFVPLRPEPAYGPVTEPDRGPSL